MTSRDRATSNRGELWVASARVGILEYLHFWPPAVFLLGELVPTVLRFLVYVLIGRIAAGEAGMAFAYVGCTVLALSGECVSGVSDIPVTDAQQRLFPQVRRGQLPPLVQYTGRAVANLGAGLLTALVVSVALGAAVGDWSLLGRVGAGLPILLVAGVSGVLFGLAAIAPAIGNDYQNLVHNLAAALVTVTSGAVFPTTVSPVLDAVAQVMPLHHAVDAMRACVAGGPWAREAALELCVGAGWGLVAAAVYRWFDRRGRRTGRGAFAA